MSASRSDVKAHRRRRHLLERLRPTFWLASFCLSSVIATTSCADDGNDSPEPEPESEPEPSPEPEPEDQPELEPLPTACLDPLELDCSLTFAPTFESIFENRIQSTCGAAGNSCHGSEGQQGGLVLDDIDVAYDSLLEGSDPPKVIPGDPECSPLMARLESDDPGFVMPVGAKLPEGERCAIRNWIAMGAEK